MHRRSLTRGVPLPGNRSFLAAWSDPWIRQRSWALTLRSLHPAAPVPTHVSMSAGPHVVRRASASMLFVRGIGRQIIRLSTHKESRDSDGRSRMRGSTSGINRRASRSPPRLPGPQPRLRFAGGADPAMGLASFRFRGHVCCALARARPRSNHRPPPFESSPRFRARTISRPSAPGLGDGLFRALRDARLEVSPMTSLPSLPFSVLKGPTPCRSD